MQLNDGVTIDGTRRTNTGYLTVSARVARADNVQTYLGSEVGRPDLATVRVFRPADEVFSKDSLSSFAHKPVTLGHPMQAVTSDNWQAVAKGWSDGEVARDGEFIRISMLLADTEAIRAVEGGTRELSMGYDCELVWGDGVSPSGERYDAKQTRIRGNHVAVVPKARGGSELRIGDSAMQTQTQDTRTRIVDQAMIDAEAAKPEYAPFRGHIARDGTPLDRHYASLNLNRQIGATQADVAARDAHMAQFSDNDRAYYEMKQRLSDGHKALNDNTRQQQATPEAPMFARDGRPMSSLADNERAYEEMCIRQQNGWRS